MDGALSVPELAQAAGLDRPTATYYCQRFADHLIPADPAAPTQWAPITVALLQIIDALHRAGYSDGDIDGLLRDDPPEPRAPTLDGIGADFDTLSPTDRIAALRKVIQQRPPPSEEAPTLELEP